MAAGEAAAAGDQVRLLFFSAGGERFALDVAFVREILPPGEITPLPFVPDTVAGIVNHRGAIYTLVRFARLAGCAGKEAGSVVLLRLPEMAVGLIVHGIEGIAELPSRLIAGGSAAGTRLSAPFLRGASDALGRPVHAVDADALIDTIYQLTGRASAGEA